MLPPLVALPNSSPASRGYFFSEEAKLTPAEFIYNSVVLANSYCEKYSPYGGVAPWDIYDYCQSSGGLLFLIRGLLERLLECPVHEGFGLVMSSLMEAERTVECRLKMH